MFPLLKRLHTLSGVVALAAMTLACVHAAAQPRLTPPTRLALEEARQAATRRQTAGTASFMPASVRGEACFECIIKVSDERAVQRLEQMGAQVGRRAGRICTARIPLSVIDSVLSLPGIEQLEASEPVEMQNDEARLRSQVDKMYAGDEYISPHTGKGVIIGVVDAGIDYLHPAFWTPNRHDNRIVRIWDQKNNGNAPEGYNYGSEYTDIFSFLVGGKIDSTSTHGSHVGCIAAGSDTTAGGRYRGMAPEADLVMVCTKATTTALMDGVAYVTDYARSVGKPSVVNLSYSSYEGERDGTRLFDQFIDSIVGPGHLVVGAAGNMGSYGIYRRNNRTYHEAYSHFSVNGNEETTSGTVEYAYSSVIGSTHGVVMWGRDVDEPFEAQLILSNAVTGSRLDTFNLQEALGTTMKKKVNYPADSSRYYGTVTRQMYRSEQNGKYYGKITWSLKPMLNVRVQVKIWPLGNHKVDAWPAAYSRYFATGDSHNTVTNTGGMANRIISVGAYYSRVGADEVAPVLDSICSFSSRGPRVDGHVKPDICAPGAAIHAAYNSRFNTTATILDSTRFFFRWYPYASMNGTSMAAPHVAGIVACWLQANPTLDYDSVLNIFKRTAISDQFTGPTPNGDWGYGKINAWEGLKEAIRMLNPDTIIEDHSQTGAALTELPAPCQWFVRRAGGELQVLGNRTAEASLALYDLSGRLVWSEQRRRHPAGVQTNVSLAGLPHGLYLLRITPFGGTPETLEFIY